MYPDWVVPAALGISLLWLGIVSFLIWKQSKFLIALFPKSGERDIRKKFKETVEAVGDFQDRLIDLDNKIEEINIRGLQHIQRAELLRFNPYGDTGGDISFTVCFLDNQGSGVVITSLHSRNGTRVFGKEVISGKSSKHELSKEEELVINKAMEK